MYVSAPRIVSHDSNKIKGPSVTIEVTNRNFDLNSMTSRRHVTSRIVINYGRKLCAPFDPCESFALIRTQSFPPPFVKKEKKDISSLPL